VRTPNIHSFRQAVVRLACEGSPLDARDRLVILPARAAASVLLRSIERSRLSDGGAVVLPDFATASELVSRLGDRLSLDRRRLGDHEREVLLGLACRHAAESAHEPPFRLRPALVTEMLELYDTLRRNRKDVASFERLALERLEPGADGDRGARRLVHQTRFLASAFAEFERRSAGHGYDEHGLRERLMSDAARRPVRHVVVTVADRAFDPYGLYDADWDLLTRLPGLERVDVVATDRMLAGAFHERIHTVLPDIEETRFEPWDETTPTLVVPAHGALVHTARDREEEVASFVRRAKRAVRRGETASERTAIVVEQPRPYLQLMPEICRSGGVPCRTFDAAPLSTEPYAAVVDLVLAAVGSAFARAAAIELLRSPHLAFGDGDERVQLEDVAALDRELSEAGYLGQIPTLERLVEHWRDDPSVGRRARAAYRAGAALVSIAHELMPLTVPAGVASHLTTLLEFLARHERVRHLDAATSGRQRRARGAVLAALRALRDGYARLDPAPVALPEVVALVRRRIEAYPFTPVDAGAGVQLVDAESARFGHFDLVQLAGLVDGEWPAPARRSVFYSHDVLRELGWPSQVERREGARARFEDLLQLASTHVVVSTFSLDDDSNVSPSPLLDTLASCGLDAVEDDPANVRVFEHEALGQEPAVLDALGPFGRAWGAERLRDGNRRGPRFRGRTDPHLAPSFSLSALERYQDCPFKYFSANVLRLEDEPDAAAALSPRARGRWLHELLQRFFDAWDARGRGPITPVRLDEARRLFAEVAEPLLLRLGETDRVIERLRLFGSATSNGVVDTVLGLEASRPEPVQERRLEFRLEGSFSLGDGGAPVPIEGVADRIDLLPGRRLRVFDYKSGAAPDPKRALQVPIYALCAQERFDRNGGSSWTVDEASYVVLAGDRVVVPVVKAGVDGRETLDGARSRLCQLIDGIGRGEFPPRPHDPAMCGVCAYSTVCREEHDA
jgi:RecB family exonuclease